MARGWVISGSSLSSFCANGVHGESHRPVAHNHCMYRCWCRKGGGRRLSGLAFKRVGLQRGDVCRGGGCPASGVSPKVAPEGRRSGGSAAQEASRRPVRADCRRTALHRWDSARPWTGGTRSRRCRCTGQAARGPLPHFGGGKRNLMCRPGDCGARLSMHTRDGTRPLPRTME